ncbi:MAG: MBL fold metallo-hydrolase [Candidatus Freyarchaeota archaeon]
MIEVNCFGEVTQIKMSREVDGRPVYWTSAFLVDGLLIDTGPTLTAEELVEFLEGKKISQVVNTHYHEDHIGANRLIQQRLGLEIYAHPESIPYILRIPELPPYREFIWGVPEPSNVLPVPQRIRTNRFVFDVVETPGHSEGHVALVEREMGWCFSGDLFVSEKPKVTHLGSNIRNTVRSMQRLVEIDTDKLILFTSPGRIIRDGHRALETCVQYLRELSQRARILWEEGLTVTAIRDTLLGGESPLAQMTGGELSSENLIRVILRDWGAL